MPPFGFIYITESEKLCLDPTGLYGNKVYSGVLSKLRFQTKQSFGFIYKLKEKNSVWTRIGFYGNQLYSGVLSK